MKRKRLRLVLLCSAFSSFTVSGLLIADSELAEFRHLTREETQPNFTYYGCEPCESPAFLPLPPSVTYGGTAAPASTANYSLTTNIINSQPFAFGGQAGLTLTVDDTSLPSGSEFWSRSEAHVQTDVEFVDIARVQGVPGGQSGTLLFNWTLTGEHQMSLDPTNSVGPATVGVIEAATTAQLSIDSAAMGLPPIPPLVSRNEFAPAGTFPPPELSSSFTQDSGATSGAVVFAVPFTAGTDIPVAFDLSVAADLGIQNLDAPQFAGALDSIFQNTATLDFVEILDSVGNPVEGASLESLSGKGIYPSENGDPDPVQDVMIDITPFQSSDDINNNLWGFIPVSILGSADFDVTQIDLSTVEMDTLPVMFLPWIDRHLAIQADTNGDSFTDYLVAIDDSDIVYERGDIIATLSGELFDGQEFEGSAPAFSVPNWFNRPPSTQAVPEPNGLGWLSILAGGSMAMSRRKSNRQRTLTK